METLGSRKATRFTERRTRDLYDGGFFPKR